jgi:septal ring factor EnvC (AmiA/AmiB activator)
LEKEVRIVGNDAMDDLKNWQKLYEETARTLKNSQDFIALLMQQLEQARKERDQVTREYADSLVEFLNKTLKE